MKCNRCCQVARHGTHMADEPSKTPTVTLRSLGEEASTSGAASGEGFGKTPRSERCEREGSGTDAGTKVLRNR
jgi:hypothetical protein